MNPGQMRASHSNKQRAGETTVRFPLRRIRHAHAKTAARLGHAQANRIGTSCVRKLSFSTSDAEQGRSNANIQLVE